MAFLVEQDILGLDISMQYSSRMAHRYSLQDLENDRFYIEGISNLLLLDQLVYLVEFLGLAAHLRMLYFFSSHSKILGFQFNLVHVFLEVFFHVFKDK